ERENVCESNQEGEVSVTKGRARSHDLLALLVDDEEVDLALRGRRLSKLQSFLSPAHERGKDRPLPLCVSIPKWADSFLLVVGLLGLLRGALRAQEGTGGPGAQRDRDSQSRCDCPLLPAASVRRAGLVSRYQRRASSHRRLVGSPSAAVFVSSSTEDRGRRTGCSPAGLGERSASIPDSW